MRFGRKVDPEVQQAYEEEYKKESILAAREQAKIDAHAKQQHSKPFYQKLGDIAVNIGKDIGNIRLSESFREEYGLKGSDSHDKKK